MNQPARPDLDAIQTRTDAATSGPWAAGQDHPQYVFASDGPVIARTGVLPTAPADTVFIAHARTDVPALIAYTRRLETGLRVESEMLTEVTAACAATEREAARLRARVAELEQQLAAAQERVQALAFDLATGSRVVEPAEFDAAFIADGACPHCNHRADRHTAGVCANCMCISPDHRWRATDLPGVERCAVEPCRARRTAPSAARDTR